MDNYIVLYRSVLDSYDSWLESPEGFSCMAEDTDHAEEQCINAYPECDIVWVSMTNSIEEAYEDYYGDFY